MISSLSHVLLICNRIIPPLTSHQELSEANKVFTVIIFHVVSSASGEP
ncbi:MAG: hypothetical protein LBD88_01220 [Candidatus Peribacteria bacterium]|nr:hypothetical protein [Candidatus Peribacteria bacterium]